MLFLETIEAQWIIAATIGIEFLVLMAFGLINIPSTKHNMPDKVMRAKLWKELRDKHDRRVL